MSFIMRVHMVAGPFSYFEARPSLQVVFMNWAPKIVFVTESDILNVSVSKIFL